MLNLQTQNKMKKENAYHLCDLQISNFTFKIENYGRYCVIYTSPVTGKNWRISTTNMSLIDATKNSDNPKIKDLKELRKLCKTGKSF